MEKMKITKAWLGKLNTCAEGVRWFVAQKESDKASGGEPEFGAGQNHIEEIERR